VTDRAKILILGNKYFIWVIRPGEPEAGKGVHREAHRRLPPTLSPQAAIDGWSETTKRRETRKGKRE
jgi:hypothetical protein